jgi:histidinol-phosphate/aromatic aminotransferase/cobyric acid decarboxylase-like protein
MIATTSNYLSTVSGMGKQDFCTSNNFDESYSKIYPNISRHEAWLISSTYNSRYESDISERVRKKFKTNFTILGSGNEELILRLKVVCDREGYKVGLVIPNFYRTLQIFQEARKININFNKKDVSGLDIVILMNPNNLSGLVQSNIELIRMFKRYPDILFIVDEASMMTVQRCYRYSLVQKCKDKSNFITFSSFSKMYGMPLLRVSFASGNLKLLRMLKKAGPTFPVSSLAWKILVDMLGEDKFLNILRTRIHDHKKELISLIHSTNKFILVDTKFNCVIVKLIGKNRLYEEMLKQGIVGLDLDTQKGAPRQDFVRLTVHSSPKKHKYLIDKFSNLIRQLN